MSYKDKEKDTEWHRQYYLKHKIMIQEKDRIRREERRNKDPEKFRLYKKDKQLQYRYGITLEDYNNLLVQQNNRCAICNRLASELSRGLVVDHDHKTNKVRGLVCIRCNTKLGWADPNKDRLLNYLIEK